MVIKFISARIDERGAVSGGVAGNQTGNELAIQDYYNHSKGWRAFRAKSVTQRTKIAEAMIGAVNNRMIGYDQSQRNTLWNYAKLVGYNPAFVIVPCECDCSSLVRVSVAYSGTILGDFNTSSEANVLLSSGQFDEVTNNVNFKNGTGLMTGDILVTAVKGHTGVIFIEATPNTSAVTTPSTFTQAIDVSTYNVITDYAMVKKSGIDYAILKCKNKAGGEDKLFSTHLSGFKSVGIPIYAVYSYSYATNVGQAVTDAQKVLTIMKKYNIGTEVRVCMDVEDKVLKNLGQTLIDTINAYKAVVEAEGYNFILYTGQYFYNKYIKPYSSQLNGSVPLWIARYYNGHTQMLVSEEPPASKKPNVGTDIDGWQYTSAGIVAGVNGVVDLSVIYNTSQTVSKKEIIINTKVIANKLNVRDYPKTGNVQRVLLKGDSVNIIGIKDGWYQIGEKEYVSSDYISKSSGKIVANRLNVRNGAGNTNEIVGVLNFGEIVNLINYSNGWVYIQNDKAVGWCSAKYIQQIS